MDLYPIKNFKWYKFKDRRISCPTKQHKLILLDYELNSLSNDTKYVVIA